MGAGRHAHGFDELFGYPWVSEGRVAATAELRLRAADRKTILSIRIRSGKLITLQDVC
jgi:hypothetical protein